MEIIIDDQIVFDILTNSCLENFDVSKIGVFSFQFQNKWCLLMFCPNGKFKGCRLFLLEKNSFEITLSEKLLPHLIALPSDNDFELLKNQTLELIESLIINRSNQSFFFEAH